MKICVVGTGYVGLVSGACLSELGHLVTCVDQNAAKVRMLQDGQIPIYEPGLEKLVIENSQLGRLRFTTDLSEALKQAKAVFIAVGTPPREDGSADLTYVLAAAASIGNAIEPQTIVINKSTVPIGTGELVKAEILAQLEKRGEDIPFHVVSNPEFLREGAAISDFMEPDRIVVGTDSEEAAAVMRELYSPLLQKGYPLITMDIISAEMTKYAANAMLATRISFMNEISGICEATGADIENIKKGIGLDSRIGPAFLSAGIGYGGSCFPKDLRALMSTAKQNGVPHKLIEAVDRINIEQKKWMINKVLGYFNGNVRGAKLGIWGAAFKPDTDDIRESPAIPIVNHLLTKGASIYIHDPIAIPNAKEELGIHQSLHYCDDPYDAAFGVHALLIVTEWQQYRTADLERLHLSMKQPVIFDGRNIYDLISMREAGFTYYSVGRRPV